MATQGLSTSWIDGSGAHLARTLRDANERADELASEHAENVVALVDEGAASGSGTPKTTTWTETQGNVVYTHELNTYQNPGESEAAWQARHDAALAAAQTEFPPDP